MTADNLSSTHRVKTLLIFQNKNGRVRCIYLSVSRIHFCAWMRLHPANSRPLTDRTRSPIWTVPSLRVSMTGKEEEGEKEKRKETWTHGCIIICYRFRLCDCDYLAKKYRVLFWCEWWEG
jgi:hypothetical protein